MENELNDKDKIIRLFKKREQLEDELNKKDS